MLGDQLATDILGAKRFGIDAALVQTGLAREFQVDAKIVPDYILPSLET
jgi:ribonucleotide monophosphatase NagD (HAD superfamily)